MMLGMFLAPTRLDKRRMSSAIIYQILKGSRLKTNKDTRSYTTMTSIFVKPTIDINVN